MRPLTGNRFRLLLLAILVLPSLACGGLSTASTAQQTTGSSRVVEVTRIVEVVVTATPKPGSTPTRPPAASPTAGPPKFQITDIDSRITESNNVWWKYAWILTLQSQSDHRLLVNAEIEFVDADGFVVDNDTEYGLLLEPWETKQFTGFALIDSSVAANVAGVNAKANITDQMYVAPAEPRPTQPALPEATKTPAQASPPPAAELPSPTAATVAEPASSNVKSGVVTETANRRSGPGTDTNVTGRAEVGAQLTIVDVSADGAWYKLQEGDWIFAALVNVGEAGDSSVEPSGTEPSAVAPQPAAVPALNQYMVGNAQPALSPPSSADFDVIQIGREDDIVYVFIRNNTATTYKRLGVDVIARGADGAMLAVDKSMDSEPNRVGPGEVIFSYVYFLNVSLPDDVQFDWDVGSTALPAGEETGDLVVAEHSRVENRFVGMLSNPGAKKVTGPIEATVLCFDESNRFLNNYSDYTTKSEVAPGAAIPFQVNVREPCPRYLIFASGHTF